MNYQSLLASVQSLSAEERSNLISALTALGDIPSEKIPSPRLTELLNKQVGCPHCGGKHYYRYGQDKGSQRFKCKKYLKTFTEYTGTWQERLHKKELVEQYILMMSEQKSLDKISTAFWGVSTKFLQNYLNWFKVKETILKTAQDQATDLFKLSMENIKSNKKKDTVYKAVLN